ncbi:DHA3 family macrolide efflux protein-like MFS transporter [Streptomyces canus]|uniref:DHA3 family macrolide efflux protein-like MFS transporter n=1 Tax=Streptomyces canus TaxID=58343 RepID=A0AAW8F6B1_9ACTN|nr:MFS transporter [Streptomyces canus]MDQ0904313.1 DHA3 family macrolide efflux protein-like MFS transporter [Streptomyces canus]
MTHESSTETTVPAAEASARLGRAFYAVQSAALLNGVGTRCGQLAVAWWSLSETGSTATFAAFVAAGSGAEIAARGLLGWLGDTYRPERLIAWCYLISSLLVAALASLYLGNRYHPAVLVVGLTGIGICNGIREPLQTTVVRLLVPVGLVETAMRRRSTVLALSSVLGPIVASLLLGFCGTGPTLVINTTAVCCSFALMRMVPAPSDEPRRVQGQPRLLTWYRSTRDGFRAAYRIRCEFQLALLALAVNLGLYPVFAVLVPALTHRAFPQDTWLIGVAEGAFGAGLFVGSTGLVSRLARRSGTRFSSVMTGFALTGTSILSSGVAAAAFTRRPAELAAALTVCFFAGGIGLIMITVNTSTVRVLATPAAMRNRITSTVAFISGLAIPIGNLLGGALAQHLGEDGALITLGLIILGSTCLSLFSRDLRHVLTLPDDSVQDAYSRLYPHAFPKENL